MQSISIGHYKANNELCKIQDFTRHLLALGVTGTGKSTLLEHIAHQALKQGVGFTVNDPHGGLVEKIVDVVPKERYDDVIWFDPLAGRVIGINPFDGPGEIAHKVEAAVTLFRKLFGESFLHSSASVLRWTLMALYELPYPPTLISAHKFLLDKSFRQSVLKVCKNPTTLDAWHKFDKEWSQNTREDRFAPVLNKLDQLINDPILKHVLGQPESGIDFRKLMDKNKILLCKLSTGLIGENGAALLGSIITQKLFEAALSRQESKRPFPEHLLIMDEFQIFTMATSIRQILAETRKYKLCAVLGTQSLQVLEEPDRLAILSNAASKICMTVGYEDAEMMRKEFATNKQTYEFQDCERFHGFVRMPLYDKTQDIERPTGPHKVKFLPPVPSEKTAEFVKRLSQQNHALPREIVAEKIKKFLGRART